MTETKLPPNMHRCVGCGHALPITKFYKQSNGSPKNKCKACEYKISNVWKSKNRPKTRSYTAAWYSRNRIHGHKHKLKYRYGLTVEKYDSMLQHQGGVCAICRGKDSKNKRLSVDHCHSTGKNRGLLCDACNRSLGGFKDSVELLLRAIDYLRGGGGK